MLTAEKDITNYRSVRKCIDKVVTTLDELSSKQETMWVRNMYDLKLIKTELDKVKLQIESTLSSL